MDHTLPTSTALHYGCAIRANYNVVLETRQAIRLRGVVELHGIKSLVKRISYLANKGENRFLSILSFTLHEIRTTWSYGKAQ